MDKYLKMADVFGLPVSDEVYMVDFAVISDSNDHVIGGFGIEGMSHHATHAINSHDELVEINKYLLSKLKEIDECFEAAYIDGLVDAFANEDIYTIKDIYCRRIEFARGVAVSAICKENK